MFYYTDYIMTIQKYRRTLQRIKKKIKFFVKIQIVYCNCFAPSSLQRWTVSRMPIKKRQRPFKSSQTHFEVSLLQLEKLYCSIFQDFKSFISSKNFNRCNGKVFKIILNLFLFFVLEDFFGYGKRRSNDRFVNTKWMKKEICFYY